MEGASRKCLKCQQPFSSTLPRSVNRICPPCSRNQPKDYGRKTDTGSNTRRGVEKRES